MGIAVTTTEASSSTSAEEETLPVPEQVRAMAEQFAPYPGVEEVVDQERCSAGACEGFAPEARDRS